MADRDPDYVDNEDDEADDEEVGGTEARGAKKRERRKRLRAEANRSSVEWQCVTIVNEEDDVTTPSCSASSARGRAALVRRGFGSTFCIAGRQPSAKVAAKSTKL